MSRPLDATTAAHVGDAALSVVYFLRLDVLGDPLLAWTGWGDMTFGAGATGDGAMDGQTFKGVTHLVGQIDGISDEVGGSQALEISLPGVNATDEYIQQIVRSGERWQFRQAWLWMAFVDDSLNVIGKPFRLKTGRMDQMVISEDESGNGTVKVVVEGQQAYASEALASRYNETHDLDPTDTSNDYVNSLANMVPTIGQAPSTPTATGGAGLYGGGGPALYYQTGK